MSDANAPLVVRSGGQSGVDLAALEAAKEAGLPTGGFLPKGWLTEDGPRPEYAERFGLEELPTDDYPARTRANVEAADATPILTRGAMGRGTALTARHAEGVAKPALVVDLGDGPDPDAVPAWLRANGVRHRNVAGPRASGSPGVHDAALALLGDLFRRAAREGGTAVRRGRAGQPPESAARSARASKRRPAKTVP